MNLFEISGINSIVYSFLVILFGFALGRSFFKLEDRSLAIVCLCVFAPAFIFRQALGQKITEHLFTLNLFFLLFHTGILILLSAGIFKLLNIPKNISRLYLLNVTLTSIIAIRRFQPMLEPPPDAFEIINSLIFYHFTISILLGYLFGSNRERLLERTFDLFKSPAIYALFIGILLAGFGYPLKYEILDGVDSLLHAFIPVALIVIGVIWGKHIYLLQAKDYTVLLPGLVICIVLRLIISPAIAIIITKLMAIDQPVLLRAYILSSAAPTGIFAALIVSFFGRSNEKRFTAFCIILTAIGSFMTIPLLVMLLNQIYPL